MSSEVCCIKKWSNSVTYERKIGKLFFSGISYQMVRENLIKINVWGCYFIKENLHSQNLVKT